MPERQPRAPAGVEFPADEKNKRSTTHVNNGAFEAAIRPVDADAADAVVKDKRKWRFKYQKHVVKNVETSARSRENALGIAEHGLTYLHENFRFVRDGTETSLRDAMKQHTENNWSTGRVQGNGPVRSEAYLQHVPFSAPTKGKELRGAELRVQVDKWVRQGVIEVDAGQALLHMAEDPNALADLKSTWFVLFGATSAMGPLEILLSMGATVVAIDLDRGSIWKNILKKAKASGSTVLFPIKSGKAQSEYSSDAELAEDCGANLLEDTPEIRNWLRTLEPPKGTQVVFGNYAYLDGPLFVKLAMAMDAIQEDFTRRAAWPGCPKAGLAYLCTPTDAHVCTPESRTAATMQHRRAPLWQKLLALVTGTGKKNARRAVQTDDGGELHVVDAIVGQQGPNYILAKRLQHWRAMLAAYRDGCVVSSNVAPSTATASVLSNFSFKVAYGGMHLYRPIEVFMQETSNSVMGLLLLHDFLHRGSAPRLTADASAGANPLTLFTRTSVHGGAWRCGYPFGAIGSGAVVGYVVGTLLASLYLILYNAMMVFGYVNVALGENDLRGGIVTMQWISALEVLHAYFGIVRAPVGTTALQVFSRVMVASVADVFFTEQLSGSDASAPGLPWLSLITLAWTVTEIVRYTFYGLNVVGMNVYPLTFLRYSLFLVLYPLGVLGECMVLYHALGPASTVLEKISAPAFHSSADGVLGTCIDIALRWICVPLYNACGRSSTVLLVVFYLMYVAGFPMLYILMLSQRKKVLGGGSGGADSKLKKKQ